MSHQEKQHIFDEYAKSQNYSSWAEIIFLYDGREAEEYAEFMSHVFAACDLLQEEHQKRIAKKFSELVHSNEVDDIFIGDYNKMKASIINPKNKIQ
ncbi:hypothetical protein [Chryseobacterium indologenes]|uniref:hypothetical protein n=1 Tax=Chryseobacterium indologenes TaxID=253 RepID=UPI003D331AFF